jgi:hypothetical protein
MGSLTVKPMRGLHAQTTEGGTLYTVDSSLFEESKNDV